MAKERAEREAHGGSGLVHVRRADLLAYRLPTPAHEEQIPIATVLDAADAAIQQTGALIAKLKLLREGLLRSLLRFGIGEDGNVRAHGPHSRFNDSPLGPIPHPWTVRPLGDAATLQRGIDLPIQKRRPGSVPVLGSNGVHGYHDQAAAQGPGVITGRSGTIGFVYFCPGRYWPLNTTLYVRDFHGNRPRFVALLLESLHLERFAAATGVPSLNRNFVHPTQVAVPPPDEQDQIVAALDTYDTSIASEEAYRDKLNLLKRGLMDDLLTGRVRVSA